MNKFLNFTFVVLCILYIIHSKKSNLKKVKSDKLRSYLKSGLKSMTTGDIIIHLTSETVYAGFAGENKPSAVFANVVGRPKVAGSLSVLVGADVLAKQSLLNLSFSVSKGEITNFVDLEIVLNHTFNNALKVNSVGKRVLITESPFSSRANREKLATLLFNTFKVSAFYTMSSSVLALYSNQQTDGLIVNIDEELTTIVPIFEGFTLSHAALRLNYGTKQCLNVLSKALKAKGYAATAGDKDLLYKIIRTKGYAALDYDAELQKNVDTSFEISSGQSISIGKERFEAVELLFDPKEFGYGPEQIADTIHVSIIKLDPDIRNKIYGNVNIIGKFANIPGLKEKLLKQVKAIGPHEVSHIWRVNTSPSAEVSSWLGGSLIAGLSYFDSNWVSSSEFSLSGVNIVHRKCIS